MTAPVRSLADLEHDALERLRLRFRRHVLERAGHWLWCSRGRPTEYGTFRCPRRVTGANRAAWLLFRGPLAKGESVLVACGQPQCVRPEHLRVVQHREIHLHASSPVARVGDASATVTCAAEVQAVLRAWNAGQPLSAVRALAPRASKKLVEAIVTGHAWRHMEPRPVRRRVVGVQGPLAAALAQEPRPRAFAGPKDQVLLVHLDPSRPGDDGRAYFWRVTRLDQGMTPMGHREAHNFRSALACAVEAGADLAREVPIG